MKYHFWTLCFAVLAFLSFSSSDLVGFNGAAPARRTLLSDSKEPETALVAGLDGTIYLFDLTAKKPLWSFSSGPPIYSSYQAPVDKDNLSDIRSGYFIDTGTGDDWELYAHDRHRKVKLKESIEDYVRSTPQIADDGIVLGSKRSTVFQVDAKTGRLISTYTMPVSPTGKHTKGELGLLKSANLKSDELALYITRTDYALTSFTPHSNKILWNVTVAEIGAAFICQDIDDPSAEALLDSGSVESYAHSNMPLPCNSRAQVHRFRGHNILERLSGPNLPEAHHPNKMLPSPPSDHILPSQPNAGRVLEMLPSPLEIDNNSDMHPVNRQAVKGIKELFIDGLSWISGRFNVFILIGFFVMLVGTICKYYLLRQPIILQERSVSPKKKRSRKLGKNGENGEKKDNDSSSDGEAKYADIEANNKLLLSLNHQTSHSGDGRAIGKLFIYNKEIAKGSNGTVVLEGIYEGRPVAVKRLVRAHHDIAFKEIQHLIASDQHPNIVRLYGVQHDQDFIYLALECCICNLNDLIQICSFSSNNYGIKNAYAETVECRIHLDSVKHYVQGIYLWKENGYPSAILLKLMRDVVSGLIHLHELGIIHRDLKPQNVLITKDRVLCAKVSDMGISKRLIGDMSSLSHHATGSGSSGWQAPEQLLHGRQTRAVDVFSLGCVLFHCLTGGSHPFGSPLERDVNVTKNKFDLFLVEHIPEAVDLLSRLLHPNADMRPKATEVIAHPLFWTPETRLSFLRDTSDRVELEDRETDSSILNALEGTAQVAVGGRWDLKLEPAILNDIGRYRRYRFDSVRDLLRVIRNKSNHYRELPAQIKELFGPVPEGFEAYFSSRFPHLLIQVYKVVSIYCREEESFKKYFTNPAV